MRTSAIVEISGGKMCFMGDMVEGMEGLDGCGSSVFPGNSSGLSSLKASAEKMI